MFYEHAIAFQNNKDVCYDEEPDILDMEGVRIENGCRVYSK